ncbi:MAG: hypothetical protein PHR66_06410 [Desulfuromonadaceae bacterium]|nr:hypothetical protein [Desulfuromonadaceae bacterium]
MKAKIAQFVIMSTGAEKEKAMKHPDALGGRPRDFWPAKEGMMKVLTRIVIPAVLMTLAILINPDVVRAQDFNYRDCAWPLEFSPEGSGNVQGPDGAARYWIMPFETQYDTMTIKGTYPNIRFFSFTAYETIACDPPESMCQKGFNLVEYHLYDAQITPDPGSSNPFVLPGGRTGTYTVVISRTLPSSGNTIGVSSGLVWVVMRMYVANDDPSLSGRSLMGGVPLPAITVTDKTGPSKQLDACWPINKWSDISKLAQFLFPPAVDLSIKEGMPSDRLWFASPLNPPSILWPNPDGKYLMMWPGDNYQSGRIIVIHGKAPGFPGTFEGSPIWTPSRGFRSVDMRYWAMCEQDFAPPLSLVGCATDLTTRLEGGYYTIVISDDRQRPGWLKPNINWLPYGDEQYPKFVVIRNMLPAPDFPYAIQNVWTANDHECTFNLSFPDVPDRGAIDEKGPCAKRIMGDYYPDAVWCDKSTFIHGGWQACMKQQ